MNTDLTVGKPEKALWKFCIPLFGSIVFQQLYNIADSLIAGRYIGENALAAVGNSYQITLILLAFAFGCNIGCSVIVSQFFGEKNYRDMKTSVYTTWIASGLLCVILMIIGIFSCKEMLELVRTPQEIFEDSRLYLSIYVWGFPFVLFYNVANGIFSALGDSKTPFIFLAFSSVANVLVDILFVKYLKMGVAGVAWATFLCQGISCVLAVIVVVHRLAGLNITEKVPYFSWSILKKIAIIAIPSFLQQSFIAIGNIIIQGTINDFGPAVSAGYSTSIKLNNLVITSFTTLGNGISNFTAQNLGAGKYKRIRQGFRAGIKMVWAICLPVVLVYMLAAEPLVHLFLKEPTQLAMKTGIELIRILSPFYFVVSVKLVADGVLRGTGNMKPFMISTFTDLILRVALAIIFAKQFGVIGIWCAWPIGWFIAMIMSVIFYLTVMGRYDYNCSTN
ncbi:MAG: MATE family efflux transporter [Agathobacter sp.]|nr:MATE family efflux transporter [Agathobacter sp.]